jgi:putative membrane protein
MRKASTVLCGLIGLQHLWFLVLEMFLWTTPMGLQTFKTTQEFANQSAVLASNQGLYNGFLAAGLIWSALAAFPKPAVQLRMFFLGCVAVAGIFGAFTVGPPLFFIQALPALIALGLVFASSRSASSGSPS